MAQFYDEFFESSRFPINAAREQVLRPILPRIETACDLGCGTGTTALAMARKGISMYAVDLSPLMCRLAREKAKRAGLNVRVLRSDMRTFSLPKPVDLVICEADALNHVPRKADLQVVGKSVAKALRPGGYFLFDVNNALGFERYWSGDIWFESSGVVVVMRQGHKPGTGKAWCDLEWFIREGSLWRRRHERLEEICWSSEEIHRALRTAGFDDVREWDAAPFYPEESVVGPGCRSVYLARKASA